MQVSVHLFTVGYSVARRTLLSKSRKTYPLHANQSELQAVLLPFSGNMSSMLVVYNYTVNTYYTLNLTLLVLPSLTRLGHYRD